MKMRILKTVAAAASGLLLAMIIMYSSVAGIAQTDRLQLNAMYQRAFYETCELVSGIQVNLKKLSVSGSAAKEQELLGEISRNAQGAQSSLSMLPISEDALLATMKFVNQTGDYSQALLRQLSNGAALSSDDRRQIATLLESCTQFGLRLNKMLSDYNEGRLTFDDYDFAFQNTSDTDSFIDPATEYPVLLYDGPFSDGRSDDDMKGITGSALTAEEACEALIRYLGGTVENVMYTGDANVPAPCYEFTFSYNGYAVSAGVTKVGGHILYMLPDAAEYTANISDEECVRNAIEFLRDRGHGATVASYHRRFRGVLTVNLAPISGGVILYPDLIKVQVSMKDGNIIGLEARNYYQNHVPRDFNPPTLTEAQALSLAGADLQCESAQLCVIPLRDSERLCYQVRAFSGDDEYLVYIDAFSGEELTLYQVVSTDDGTLTQ